MGLLALASAVQGCHGTQTSTAIPVTTPATPGTNATGVWSGGDQTSGLAIVGIINAAGEAYFIRSDGVLFTGETQVSTGTLAVALDGYSNFGSTFPDGSTYGVGTLNGTVTTVSTLSGTVAFNTSAGTSIPGNWSLNYDALSTIGSSLTAIGGNYTDAASGATVSITGGGVMTSQVPANSCVLNGTVSSADTSTDVYEVTYTYASCTGTYAVLNGVPLSGLAVRDTNVSPTQVIMAVSSQSATGNYAIYSVLTGT
jgi:hypothetical protein